MVQVLRTIRTHEENRNTRGSVLVCERKNSVISTLSHFAGFTCTLHTGARGVLNIAVVMSIIKKYWLNRANQWSVVAIGYTFFCGVRDVDTYDISFRWSSFLFFVTVSQYPLRRPSIIGCRLGMELSFPNTLSYTWIQGTAIKKPTQIKQGYFLFRELGLSLYIPEILRWSRLV